MVFTVSIPLSEVVFIGCRVLYSYKGLKSHIQGLKGI